MANKEIKTEQAPAAIGPYSQGISAENIAFVSGQLPIDPATGEFAGERHCKPDTSVPEKCAGNFSREWYDDGRCDKDNSTSC